MKKDYLRMIMRWERVMDGRNESLIHTSIIALSATTVPPWKTPYIIIIIIKIIVFTTPLSFSWKEKQKNGCESVTQT